MTIKVRGRRYAGLAEAEVPRSYEDFLGRAPVVRSGPVSKRP